MIKNPFYFNIKTLCHSLAIVAVLFAFSTQSFAQTTPTAAETNIVNQASATYSDGTNNYTTVSNPVTVTVAKVAGLVITPDNQTNPTVVPGQQTVPFTFTVTNVGNFTDEVRFLANGGSIVVTGPATVASATVNGVSIAGANPQVLQSLAQGASATVTVNLNITPGAAPGATIQVFLGDTSSGTNFDNEPAGNSANEVNTVSTGAVNGSREARGDISTTVENDAVPQVNLTVPTTPVAIGGNIDYSAEVCNTGLRPLTDAYVIVPIPVGTELVTAPAGTLYSTDPLTTDPQTANYTPTPGALSSVRRIRMPAATPLAPGACSAPLPYTVRVTATNADTPIYAIAEVFGKNSVGATVTDQSGDVIPGKGDGNANFDEPILGGTATPNQGFQQPTPLIKTGGVFFGPSAAPQATGPTSTNDDYTNKSGNAGINVPPGSNTTAPNTVVFTNTLQNPGNSTDTFTLTAPTVPAGSTVEISTDGGVTFVPVTTTTGPTVTVGPNGATADIQVRVTLPAGNPVLTGYDTVIRATSGNDPTKTNDTIDRLYTGFVRLDKSFTVANGTGVGGANDAVPGAVITYVIAYTNVSSTGGTGSLGLTANNLVITENGNAAPNNWGTTTTQVVGSATDSVTGTANVTGDAAGSTVLTDTVPTLAAGANGTFTFKRTIN